MHDFSADMEQLSCSKDENENTRGTNRACHIFRFLRSNMPTAFSPPYLRAVSSAGYCTYNNTTESVSGSSLNRILLFQSKHSASKES